MDGPEMEGGYNLYYINNCLSNFHRIIDKAYLVLSDKSRMTERDRDLLKIKVAGFDRGSFKADLSILLPLTQLAIPYVTMLSPKRIWAITKQTWELINVVLELKKRKEPIAFTEGENNMINVVQGNNNTIIQIFPESKQLAKDSWKDYQELTRSIAAGKVDEISITDKTTKESNGITIGGYEKQLFQTTKRIETNPVRITAEIYRIDGYALSGKMNVIHSEDDTVPPGQYGFDLLNEHDILTCGELLMKPSNVTALREITYSPSDWSDVVTRLKIVSLHKSA